MKTLCAPLDGKWDLLALDQRVPFSLYLPSLADRRFPPIGRRDLRALILEANPAELSRPEVAIIADRFGKRDKVETVKLTKKDEKTGKHTRTILRTIDPHRYKLEVARYIY